LAGTAIAINEEGTEPTARPETFHTKYISSASIQCQIVKHRLYTVASIAATSGKVWVNTRSGKYWKPGSRYYGATKQGEFMTEKEAIQKGYRPANGTGQ
jgi:hypothetical protein